MIITRSPLRITLGGGGTDLPSYYRKYGGFVISAAIDKYVYVAVARSFTSGISLRHAQVEQVLGMEEIQHPILRETIRMLDLQAPRMEISTFSDIPAGTGLGSSGSLITALLKALHVYQRRSVHAEELAQ